VAIVVIAPQKIVKAGLAPAFTGSLSTGNTYRVNNDGKTALHFKKTGAGACTVTIDTPRSVAGLAIAQHTVNVPATTGDVMVAGLLPGVFNQVGAGYVEFTLSEVTGLTVAALQLE